MSRIIPLGASDNFWGMGETGPCGVCTEIHYTTRHVADANAESLLRNSVEVWNIVFIQYNR